MEIQLIRLKKLGTCDHFVDYGEFDTCFLLQATHYIGGSANKLQTVQRICLFYIRSSLDVTVKIWISFLKSFVRSFIEYNSRISIKLIAYVITVSGKRFHSCIAFGKNSYFEEFVFIFPDPCRVLNASWWKIGYAFTEVVSSLQEWLLDCNGSCMVCRVWHLYVYVEGCTKLIVEASQLHWKCTETNDSGFAHKLCSLLFQAEITIIVCDNSPVKIIVLAL